MPAPKLICMTPVKNEAWILERFLHCASVWADHIIVADQGSDDGTREIARSFPKVTLVENTSETFCEIHRQKLLISEARKIDGPKVLFALDADEIFTADFIGSDDWRDAIASPPGTVLDFRWACVLPDGKTYYEYPADFPFGYVDDGAEHVQGRVIHGPRVPIRDDSPRKPMGMRVMHLSVLDAGRFKSKVRWYQTWEFLNKDWGERYLELYRIYHRDHHINKTRIKPLPSEWLDGYGSEVDLLDNKSKPFYHRDLDLLKLFDEHGTAKFHRLNVWDVDWNEIYRQAYGQPPSTPYDDPRTWVERLVHRWMERTQKFYSPDPPKRSLFRRKLHRLEANLLQKFGW